MGILTLYIAFYHLLVSGVDSSQSGVQHRLIGLSGDGMGVQEFECGKCLNSKLKRQLINTPL